jgi:hypothetical protein
MFSGFNYFLCQGPEYDKIDQARGGDNNHTPIESGENRGWICRLVFLYPCQSYKNRKKRLQRKIDGKYRALMNPKERSTQCLECQNTIEKGLLDESARSFPMV